MTDKLTDAEIAEARELIAKATPGPWETFDPEAFDGRIQVVGQTVRDGGRTSTPVVSDGCFLPDAAFIAASRTGWPAALDALEEAGRELDGYKIGYDQLCDDYGRVRAALATSDAARVRAEGGTEHG